MRQEARTAAALSHPVMVTLHDMGEDDAVGLYLVFERIAGPTLRERLAQTGPPRARRSRPALRSAGLGAAADSTRTAAGVVQFAT